MEHRLDTYHLRRYVNIIVESTVTSPSLAEMVHHHLDVLFARGTRRGSGNHAPDAEAWYEVHDVDERFIRLLVSDARAYPDSLYRRAQALLRIGVNGALANPDDDQFAHEVFGRTLFRTCPHCGYRCDGWLDYYGHMKLGHWGTPNTWSA